MSLIFSSTVSSSLVSMYVNCSAPEEEHLAKRYSWGLSTIVGISLKADVVSDGQRYTAGSYVGFAVKRTCPWLATQEASCQ